ncbi:protein ANTAGONIST OF LIKE HETEROCHROMATIN PROTEIN 1-like [Coccinella septempunctata]|uniref:protein ANTAGONIST OF LIKE HETEROCHROMATIN PROTEIN 1-like n=1 Tax=Coccinella septempunctata TaxID=41139 RepID=UPI001D08B1F1|nr:protein ANTAGONIST OF LIKE HETEROCHROMATIN PROTEIN 1-like [Coccinella septempunctata]
MDDDAVLAAAAAIIIGVVACQPRPRPRRFWVRPSIKKGRQRYGASEFMKDLLLDVVDELNLEYRNDVGFIKFFRMKSTDFYILLRMIGPKIAKQNTSFREAIPASERLAVTLRFLATGDSYHSLMYLMKISKQTISSFMPEVCDAIVEALQGYIKMPQSGEEWESIAKQFEEKWNFPNCVGAIDGKHIALKAPVRSGSDFFNYKGYFSIVLLAVVDANYNFIYVNVGCQGKISDGGVFNNTFFKKALEENSLHFPPPRALPGRSSTTPFVIVADDAFPLSPNIMKAYSGSHDKGSKKMIFGYRLSRARRVSENAFGAITNSFRVFRSPMATKVTMAAVCLHNYLRKSSSRTVYNPVGIFDSESIDDGEIIPGFWRHDASSSQLRDFAGIPRRSTAVAQAIRDEFAEYFISPIGKLNFQNNK